MVSAHLRIPGLRKPLAGRECWQGWSVNRDVITDLITLDGRDEYMTHSALGSNTDSAQLAAVVARALACDVDIKVLTMAPWTAGRALVADRFGSGRVFLCGDSAHLFTPTGGLGMNTGVDDAANLAWKLAAVLQGWGGPELLASYEAERHHGYHRMIDELELQLIRQLAILRENYILLCTLTVHDAYSDRPLLTQIHLCCPLANRLTVLVRERPCFVFESVPQRTSVSEHR